MLDPGALGTLVIGLERVRREQESVDSPTRRPARSARTRSASRVVAGWLRGLADIIEPRPARRDVPTEA